jgi:hypothetical protein
MWREGLGCYKIITENKKGYRNHPATKEFIECPQILHKVLGKVQGEMFARGYHPKALPLKKYGIGKRKPWQSLKEQTEILKAKKCKCKI